MRIRPTSAVLGLLLGFAALAAPGCETTQIFQGDPEEQVPEDDEWQETETIAIPDFDLAWQRTRATCEAMGYDIDVDRTRYDRKLLVSRWVTTLGRNRFEGYRRRANIQFRQVDGGRWIVSCAVVKQWNADLDDPTNPAQAQWERTNHDISRTALLLYRVRAGLVEE